MPTMVDRGFLLNKGLDKGLVGLATGRIRRQVVASIVVQDRWRLELVVLQKIFRAF